MDRLHPLYLIDIKIIFITNIIFIMTSVILTEYNEFSLLIVFPINLLGYLGMVVGMIIILYYRSHLKYLYLILTINYLLCSIFNITMLISMLLKGYYLDSWVLLILSLFGIAYLGYSAWKLFKMESEQVKEPDSVNGTVVNNTMYM